VEVQGVRGWRFKCVAGVGWYVGLGAGVVLGRVPAGGWKLFGGEGLHCCGLRSSAWVVGFDA